MLVVCLTGFLDEGERRRTREGQAGAVKQGRIAMHEELKDEMCGRVSHELGRWVRDAMVDVDPEDDLLVEAFVMDPEPTLRPI